MTPQAKPPWKWVEWCVSLGGQKGSFANLWHQKKFFNCQSSNSVVLGLLLLQPCEFSLVTIRWSCIVEQCVIRIPKFQTQNDSGWTIKPSFYFGSQKTGSLRCLGERVQRVHHWTQVSVDALVEAEGSCAFQDWAEKSLLSAAFQGKIEHI